MCKLQRVVLSERCIPVTALLSVFPPLDDFEKPAEQKSFPSRPIVQTGALFNSVSYCSSGYFFLHFFVP